MRITKSTLLKENKTYILENLKQAKQYLNSGKIDGYDGLDDQLSPSAIKTFTQITGLK